MATCRSSSSGNMFKENIDVSELTLPSIAGRLSRLETQGLSYDELQQFFGSRRRVGPVKEKSSVKHVATPAQETDRIVQVNMIILLYLVFASIHNIISSIQHERLSHASGYVHCYSV